MVGLGEPEPNARGECVRPRQRRYSEKRESPDCSRGERQDRYIICTKPFNPKHTVQYFIADLEEGVRGPDDFVFCLGYETQEQCEERLRDLQKKRAKVSWRRRVVLEEDPTKGYEEKRKKENAKIHGVSQVYMD